MPSQSEKKQVRKREEEDYSPSKKGEDITLAEMGKLIKGEGGPEVGLTKKRKKKNPPPPPPPVPRKRTRLRGGKKGRGKKPHRIHGQAPRLAGGEKNNIGKKKGEGRMTIVNCGRKGGKENMFIDPGKVTKKRKKGWIREGGSGRCKNMVPTIKKRETSKFEKSRRKGRIQGEKEGNYTTKGERERRGARCVTVGSGKKGG